MEFVCEKSDWVSGVRLASYAISARSNLPILAGIKLEVAGSRLLLQATNLDRAVRCEIPIESKGKGGAVVLNGSVLNQIAAHLPADDKVTVRAEGAERTTVSLRCGEASFDLPTLPAEEYPEIPALPSAKVASLSAAQFHHGLEHTAFAALKAGETTRLSLTGVDLVWKGDQLRMVATNGYRLAVKTLPVPEPHEEGEYLVEASVLTDLDRVLAQVDASTLDVHRGEGQLFFHAAGVTFMARTLHDEFPDFERVIPRDNPIALEFDRRALLDALQRIQITASEDSGAITFRATPEETAVRITSSSKDKGEAEERVHLKKSPSRAVEISFRAEYVIDVLKRVASEGVTLWLADAKKAGLLEPSGDTIAEADQGFLYVCMPVLLST
ncbi:MAG: DNA polymerase III subunit beta [Candidatus Bipolaricaulota bacterium]